MSRSHTIQVLEGRVLGLEFYGTQLRSVWLERFDVQIDPNSKGTEHLRLNRPVQVRVRQQGPAWVLVEAFALPQHPTLVELEPRETPPLTGFDQLQKTSTPFQPQLRYV